MAVKLVAATLIAAVVALASTSHAKTIANSDQFSTFAQPKTTSEPIIMARFGGGNSPGGGLGSGQVRQDYRAGPFYTERGNRFGYGTGRRFLDFGLKKEFDRDDVHRKRRNFTPIILPRDFRIDR